MKDVTNDVVVNIDSIDGELLPVSTCVCGQFFGYGWTDFTISIYDGSGDYPIEPRACPSCGAKLFFRMSIKIYQVEAQDD